MITQDTKRTAADLAIHLNQPQLPVLLRRFLYTQLQDADAMDVPLSDCPNISGKISLHYSAATTFYAPSDPSGLHGIYREHIRATPAWRNEGSRYDCAFINRDPDQPGMRGLDIGRILHLLSFTHNDKYFPCALVHWFALTAEEPDEDTGMWLVEPLMTARNERFVTVIHLDCVIRAAHLVPAYGEDFVPDDMQYSESLDYFPLFYVNKFVDHHAFETVV